MSCCYHCLCFPKATRSRFRMHLHLTARQNGLNRSPITMLPKGAPLSFCCSCGGDNFFRTPRLIMASYSPSLFVDDGWLLPLDLRPLTPLSERDANPLITSSSEKNESGITTTQSSQRQVPSGSCSLDSMLAQVPRGGLWEKVHLLAGLPDPPSFYTNNTTKRHH